MRGRYLNQFRYFYFGSIISQWNPLVWPNARLELEGSCWVCIKIRGRPFSFPIKQYDQQGVPQRKAVFPKERGVDRTPPKKRIRGIGFSVGFPLKPQNRGTLERPTHRD